MADAPIETPVSRRLESVKNVIIVLSGKGKGRSDDLVSKLCIR